jgi:hypothetical protein
VERFFRGRYGESKTLGAAEAFDDAILHASVPVALLAVEGADGAALDAHENAFGWLLRKSSVTAGKAASSSKSTEAMLFMTVGDR